MMSRSDEYRLERLPIRRHIFFFIKEWTKCSVIQVFRAANFTISKFSSVRKYKRVRYILILLFKSIHFLSVTREPLL